MQNRDRTLYAIGAFALAKLLFHFLTNGQYGFHRDELATLDDARHLAWGFVAYPPLTPFLGRIELVLFGTSLAGFRFFNAAAQSLVVVLAALTARRMGGGAAAQWIAALATAIGPVSLAASALFQYVSFDLLWWVCVAFFFCALLDSGDPRWWLAIGGAIGLGVMTKYTMAFLVAGVVVAVLATPLRRHLRSGWLWAGVALSVAVAAPNILWQVRNGFVTLDFLNHIHARDVRIGRTDGFLIEQLFVPANLVTVPIWACGLGGLLFSQRLRRFHPLVPMLLVPFLLFVFAKGRAYYAAPVYVPLLAAGATLLTSAAVEWRPAARRAAAVAVTLLLVAGSAVAVVALPIATPGSRLWRFALENNGDFREEIGWPELTAEVARIWRTLPEKDRATAGIFASNYGEAGALSLYGPALGLPAPISGINSYWARGYGNAPDPVIVLGAGREDVEQSCHSVTLAGRITNRWGVENEETRDHPDIYLCRGMKVPWRDLWPRVRGFG